MQLNGNLVVVPYWLKDAVTQMGLPKSDLLNIGKLSNHFSTDDMVTYHGLNQLFNMTDFSNERGDIAESFISYSELFNGVDLVNLARGAIDDNTSDNDSTLKLLSNIQNGSLVFLKETDSMNLLFSGVTSVAYGSGSSTNPNLYVIDLFHIEDDTFGLTFKLYDELALDAKLIALKRNVEFLLTYYKYEEVCQTPLFHSWCERIYRTQQ